VQALNKFQSEVGGPLKGGDPGTRLIEPGAATGREYFSDVPEPFVAADERVLVTPLHHIFGSEPLSMLTPGVAELAPAPYVALNVADAERLQAAEGEPVSLQVGPLTLTLALRVAPSLPPGVAGLPVGLPGLPYAQLPGWGKVSRSEEGQA